MSLGRLSFCNNRKNEARASCRKIEGSQDEKLEIIRIIGG